MIAVSRCAISCELRRVRYVVDKAAVVNKWNGWDCLAMLPKIVLFAVTEKIETKRSRLVRMEQMSVECVHDFVDKLSKPGELIIDLFSGIFATAKACLEHPRHCGFAGCKVDAG